MSSDEELRLRRNRTEEKLRTKVTRAEREYHAAVAEYKQCLGRHAGSEASPKAREAILRATRAHHTAVEKYSEALQEFNRLIIQTDSLDWA